ncbi:pecanex-like protein 4 [Hyalella azteca]|uniref:Pecanex-like protein n=1 Tax=Hyalella azteca TaxID=294128 RepID=A0A979FG44_HYAAZ|nr:pecanex-like protein 4 [Hyalella azteca]
MEAPLVNEYKQPFIWRRLLQTFLGGLRLSMPGIVPHYAYLLQGVLFVPLGLGLTVFLALEDCCSLPTFAATLGCGAWTFLYCLLLMFISYILQSQQEVLSPSDQDAALHLSAAFDEEMTVFDGVLGPSTWRFIAPGKGSAVVSVLHCLMAAVTSAAMVSFLSIASTASLLQVSWTGSVALAALGVWSTNLALWGLVSAPPPEPAVFGPLLPYQLAAFSRPSHLLLAALLHLLHSFWPGLSWLRVLNFAVHVLVALLGLLWCSAALPPVDALVLWLLEQWHVLALGCSPCASNARLYVQCAVSTTSLLLLAALPSYPLLLCAAALRGAILGLDYEWLVMQGVSANCRSSVGLAQSSQQVSPRPSQRLPVVSLRREVAVSAVLVTTVLITSLAVLLPHRLWLGSPDYCSPDAAAEYSLLHDDVTLATPPVFASMSLFCVGVACLLLWLVWCTASTAQQVWCCGGLIRNVVAATPVMFCHDSYKAIICQACSVGGPVLLLVCTLLWVGADQCSMPWHFSISWLLQFIPLARVFTQIWTSRWLAFAASSVFFVLELTQALTRQLLPGYLTLSVAARITLCSIALLWLRRVLQHCFAVLLITYTSVVDKKQRRPISVVLAAINIAAMPALCLLVVTCAVLNAPLLPVFTLPLFLLGYPRPERFWPYSVGHSVSAAPDAAYYAQLTPYLLSLLVSCHHSGALGFLDAGDQLLLRFEDRLVWIQVLEIGFGHVYFSVKGLELQETSCHTVEASKVDSIFSRSFDAEMVENAATSQRFLNPNALHCLTPLFQVPLLAYSDTQNVLTGVIDSNDFLSVVNDYFTKCLLFELLDYVINVQQAGVGEKSISACRTYSSKSRRSISSASYDVLTSLPKLNAALSPNTSEALPETSSANSPDADISAEDNGRRSKDSRSESKEDKDSRSLQSGRGSRLAWANKSKPNSTIDPRLDWEQDIFDLSSDRLILNPDGLLTKVSGRMPTLSKQGSRLSLHRDFNPIAGKSQNFVLTPPNASPVSHGAMSLKTSTTTNQVRQKHKMAFDSPQGLASPAAGNDPSNMTVTSVRVLPRSQQEIKERKVPISGPAVAYGPPALWLLDLPCKNDTIDDMQVFFPLSWFKFLLGHFLRLRFKADREQRKESSQIKLASKSELKNGKKSRKSSKKKLPGSSGGKHSAAHEKYGSNVENNSSETPEDLISPAEHRTLQKILDDESLEEAYRAVAAVCSVVLCAHDSSRPPSPHQVYCTFRGAIPASPALSWLTQRPRLRALTNKAYRMAVKVSLDHVLIGLNSSSWPDLLEALSEYHTAWFFGSDQTDQPPTQRRSPTDANTNSPSGVPSTRPGAADGASRSGAASVNIAFRDSGHPGISGSSAVRRISSDALHTTDDNVDVAPRRATVAAMPPERGHEVAKELEPNEPQSWVQAIHKETPHLFTIGYNDVKRVYTSRLASLRPQEASLGRLSKSAVTAVWSALSPELLYLTNDDDERYSIQAHASLLRNLTVQAADPPLGYPVYSSPAVRVGISSLRRDRPAADAASPP